MHSLGGGSNRDSDGAHEEGGAGQQDVLWHALSVECESHSPSERGSLTGRVPNGGWWAIRCLGPGTLRTGHSCAPEHGHPHDVTSGPQSHRRESVLATRGGAGHLGRTETQRGRLRTACGQRPVDNKNSQTTPATTSTTPQYANYWAPLTRNQHILPHPAQPQHTNYWAPQTPKQHQQEHRPQRPTERSDPTQHAKGRAGDCPGPCQETTTQRNVTQGVRIGVAPLIWFGLWRCWEWPPHVEPVGGGGGAVIRVWGVSHLHHRRPQPTKYGRASGRTTRRRSATGSCCSCPCPSTWTPGTSSAASPPRRTWTGSTRSTRAGWRGGCTHLCRAPPGGSCIC